MAVMEARCRRLVLIVVVILISSPAEPEATPSAVEATPTDWRGADVTEAVREARSSSRTRSACRLLATDPYLSNRVRRMSAEGKTHLIKYTIQFPDGFSHNITGRAQYCLAAISVL